MNTKEKKNSERSNEKENERERKKGSEKVGVDMGCNTNNQGLKGIGRGHVI